MLLEGRVAFVTGGGSGIGRATALTFAREGAKVAITDLDAVSAGETARMILDLGGQAYGKMLDVTEVASVDACIDAVVDRWGRLDIAFNNAGVSLEGIHTPWGDTDAWERSIAINAGGVVNCIRAEFRHMIPAGRGAIVNTASIAGLGGLGGPGYCGSKHAVVGITRSAAMSVAHKGIRVNAVCPGTIETPMTAPLLADEKLCRSLPLYNRWGVSANLPKSRRRCFSWCRIWPVSSQVIRCRWTAARWQGEGPNALTSESRFFTYRDRCILASSEPNEALFLWVIMRMGLIAQDAASASRNSG